MTATATAHPAAGPGGTVADLEPPRDGAAVLRNIERVLPTVAEQAAECERIGHLTDELRDLLTATGAFRAGFAKTRGGPELSLVEQTRMVELVARSDAGVAWNVAVLAATGFYAGRLPADGYAELYPHFDLPTAGSFHPRGRAERVDGGYRITGTWSFGSGIHSAAYVLGGSAVFENGAPVLKADGSQLIIGAWFRTDEVEILDDWHVVGLRASGSSGYRVTDHFVPDRWTFDRYFEPDPHAEPLNKLVDLPFYSMAGIAVGLAQHAVDIATESLRRRPEVGERQCAILGEAESLVRAARATVYAGVRRIDEAVFTDGELPTDEDMARGDAPVATEIARRVVDLCAELSGSRLVYDSFPMEKVIRDLVGLTAHASTWRARYVDVGRTCLAGSA